MLCFHYCYLISVPSSLKTKNPFVLKKQRVHENVKADQERRAEMRNGHSLDTREIEKALETVEETEGVRAKEAKKALETVEETDSVRAKEAKSLSVHKDKELCVKRLNSSWTNLNHSKRDFGAADLVTKPGSARETDTTLSSKQSANGSRKKKISDYFQPSSKS